MRAISWHSTTHLPCNTFTCHALPLTWLPYWGEDIRKVIGCRAGGQGCREGVQGGGGATVGWHAVQCPVRGQLVGNRCLRLAGLGWCRPAPVRPRSPGWPILRRDVRFLFNFYYNFKIYIILLNFRVLMSRNRWFFFKKLCSIAGVWE